MRRLTSLLFADLENCEEIAEQMRNFLEIELLGSSSDEDEVLRKISLLTPNILFVDYGDGSHINKIINLIKKAKSEDSRIFIVVMFGRGTTINMGTFFEAGAKEFIHKPITKDEIDVIISRYYKSLKEINPFQPEKKSCKIISFFSPKGGCGKTFISFNVAIGIANLTEKKVLYMDCSLPFSDVPILFNIVNSKKNLFDLVSAINNSERINIEEFVWYMEDVNLSILLAPDDLMQADALLKDPDRFSSTLDYLKKLFDYIVIDTSPRFYGVFGTIIDMSNEKFAIITSEKTSIVYLYQYKEELMKNGISSNFKIIMNKRNKKNLSQLEDLEGFLPEGVFAFVDDDYSTVSTSYFQGRPVISYFPKTKIAQDLMNLTKSIVQVVENG